MIFYLICTSPRSGSNLLCEALTRTGVAGAPQEYFVAQFQAQFSRQLGIDPQLDYLTYLREIFSKTASASGLCGAKLMQRHLAPLLAQLRTGRSDRTDREVLEDLLPGVRLIFLTREDKLRQAISFSRARQTRSWTARQTATATPVFDFAKVDALVVQLRDEEQKWKAWCALHGFEPLALTYEELTGAYEATVAATLEFLGAPAAPIRPPERLLPQRDALSEEWVARYEAAKNSSAFPKRRLLSPGRLFRRADPSRHGD